MRFVSVWSWARSPQEAGHLLRGSSCKPAHSDHLERSVRMGKHGRRRLLCTSPRSVTSRVAPVPELALCAAHPRFGAASIPRGGGGRAWSTKRRPRVRARSPLLGMRCVPCGAGDFLQRYASTGRTPVRTTPVRVRDTPPDIRGSGVETHVMVSKARARASARARGRQRKKMKERERQRERERERKREMKK